MLCPHILDSFEQLLPLVIPVPPPRLPSGRAREREARAAGPRGEMRHRLSLVSILPRIEPRAASSRLRVDLLPCPDLRKERYRPSLSRSPAEVESRLLMAAEVQLPPQLEQKIGHLRQQWQDLRN